MTEKTQWTYHVIFFIDPQKIGKMKSSDVMTNYTGAEVTMIKSRIVMWCFSCTLPGDVNRANHPTCETHHSTGCFSNRCSNTARLEDQEDESTPRVEFE